MTDQPIERSRSPLARTVDFASRLRARPLVQGLALVLAAIFAYRGAQLLNEGGRTVQVNFDRGLPWLGLALLATLVAAWEPSLPRVDRPWQAALAEFWRAHRLEIALFLAIFAFGAFMRLYRFGETLPPGNALCCEEHINGGVAWRALHGDRPLPFPLERWASAGGFWLFGEDTLGLRFFFVAMGIATLAPFYLLLRQLVSMPASLFGLALYSAAWWPSLFNRQVSEGTFFAVIFTFLLVRGLKTKSPLMFWGAGIFAGLVSYEYEPFKEVPIIAAGFVACAAVREVFLRSPLALSAVRERARSVARAAWRPALIFSFACAITLVPLIVGVRQGQDLYLASVHRQENDRAGDRFADNWRQQVRWATQLYSPLGKNAYPTQPPMDVGGVPVLDPLAAWLAVAGLATALVLFWRPYRLLFASWVLINLAAGALLLSTWAAWKFVSLVPVMLVLASLFVDDMIAFIRRYLGALRAYALAGVLALAAAYSFWWNADTLYNNVAPNLQPAYGSVTSHFYAYCDYMRDRGLDNYNVAFAAANPILGFVRPRDTLQQEDGAWGDFIWACEGLEGEALPAAEEAWPLRNLPAGPVTLVFAGNVGPKDELIRQLNRAYPGLGQPDRVITGPADLYFVLGYEFASGKELSERQGLWATYTYGAAGPGTVQRVDPAHDLSFADPPVPTPFRARWQGLVYREQPGPAMLRAVADGPVDVRIDGRPADASPLDLAPGWHTVEIGLQKQAPGGRLALRWVEAGGVERAVAPDELFALESLEGWLNTEVVSFTDGSEQTTERFAFAPHYTSAGVVSLQAQQQAGKEGGVKEERWRGVWRVERADTYTLRAEYLAGTVSMLLDGQPVGGPPTVAGPRPLLEATVTVPEGRHTLELVQTHDGTEWSGAMLTLYRPEQPGGPGTPPSLTELPLKVDPY